MLNEDEMSLDIRYIAGFFDGEGSIGMAPKGSGFLLRISISNVNLEVLTKIKERFGGFINKRPATDKWKVCYQWCASYNVAIAFLEAVLPHLVVKKEHALVALEWKKHRLGSGAWKGAKADEARAKILAIRNKLMDLNAWSGNKTRNGRKSQVHPATVSMNTPRVRRKKRYLTPERVLEIKSFKGKMSITKAAKHFDIHTSHIAGIWQGRTWSHIQ